MDLLSIIAGIILGAAFSPFWMMVWGKIRAAIDSKKEEPPPLDDYQVKPIKKPRKPKTEKQV
jgi:hypothetical protein